MIGYGRQDISEEDISEVVATLRSDYLTQGPRISDFERSVATLCGVENGVAVNSATSALHLACIALEVGPGDTIWTSPITFVASANCGRYCGANVDFVDIDLKSNNLCVHKLEEKLEISKKRGVLPKVVIPVHMAGHSCNMKRIWELSKEYGFRVIEDASHALGGKYRDGRVGSCQFSDITVFSFHAVKIITTAEGGMALTKCDALSKKMRHYRSHGITRHPDDFINDACGPWYYEQHDLGFNYRMSDLQAALGISQVKRLERILSKRDEIARFYDEALKDLPLIPPMYDPEVKSSNHLYILKLAQRDPDTRARLFSHLHLHEVGTNVHYIPVHFHPYYQKLGFKRGSFPVAEDYYDRILTLPIHLGLSQQDLNHIASVVRGFFSR